MADYIIKNYNVKNIVLVLSASDLIIYNGAQDSYENHEHVNVTDSSRLQFYAKYAFCDIRYSFDKIKSYLKDTELPQDFDMYNASTGCFDNRVCDVEKIGDMKAYEATYSSGFSADKAEISLADVD